VVEILGDNKVFLTFGETWEIPVSLWIIDTEWDVQHGGKGGVVLTVKPATPGITKLGVEGDEQAHLLWAESDWLDTLCARNSQVRAGKDEILGPGL